MSEPSLTDQCVCGHGYDFHRESRAADEQEFFSAEERSGCWRCPCTAFAPAVAAPQTPAADPPPAGHARLVQADERQVAVILQLARAAGASVLVNWDEMPTRMTKHLSLAQMGAAGLVRATAQLLASALEHLPDADERALEAVDVHVEMLRESFRQAREDLKARAIAPPTDQPAGSVSPPTVLVSPPKWLM